MSRILIVDSYPIIRRAVRLKLESAGHEVIGKAENGRTALAMSRERQPDLVILDLAISQLGGLDLIRRLKSHDERLKVLVFTGDAPHLASRCLHAGADGFVAKQDDLLELRSAVRAVLQGRSYFPSIALEALGREPAHAEEHAQLSAREFTVLQHLVKGISSRAIANELAISFKTVSTYKTRLMAKLHAGSLVELAEIARRDGLLLGDDGRPATARAAPAGEALGWLSGIIDGMPAQLYVGDIDGHLLFANRAFCAAVGQPLELLQGQRLVEQGWIAAADVEVYRGRYEQAICRVEPCSFNLVQQIDGQRRVIQHWGMPYRDAQGGVLGMICGALDITEREEQLLQHSNARLQAEAVSRASDQLLQRMHHELQAPLQAVNDLLRLASQEPVLAVQTREALPVAQQAVAQLLRLSDELNDLARLQMGLLSLDSQPVDAGALTEACVQTYRAEALQRGLELVCSLDRTVPSNVWVDPRRFTQIVDQLLSNALNSTDYGRIEVTLRTVPCGKARVELQLAVSDSGVGIAEEDLPLLFEPFALAPDPLARSCSGLGLALSWRLAQAMGGTLSVQGQPGLGSCFTLDLCLPQAMEVCGELDRQSAALNLVDAQRGHHALRQVMQQLGTAVEGPPLEWYI
ncbi:response regulator [Pseudomonas sp. LS44]|nr:response regulator [Pseudomonas sp. LS44]UVE19308.1 response regulator [Pseudomonas sp. LS44]